MSTLLEEALESNAEAIHRGVEEAERELEACRTRCTALESLLARGRAALNALEGNQTMPGGMYLQDAMVKVLEESASGALRAGEIAKRVNDEGLYRQRNGGPVTAHQIHARVYNYDHLFKRTAEGIALKEA